MDQHAVLRRWIGIVTLVVVITNVLLFSFRIVSALTFWIVIGLAAIIAWPVLNRLKK
ncbi:MAG: hypothetical protein V1725_06385 [archaeon]